MALTETFLRRSRARWVKKERDYRKKAEHAHGMHKRRERELAAIAAAAGARVVMPMKTILTDTWGYHPPTHDGVDLICPANEPLIAMCRATVVRVSDEWWGAGNPGGATGDKGDGIIILRCTGRRRPVPEGPEPLLRARRTPDRQAGDDGRGGPGDRQGRVRERVAHPFHGQRPVGHEGCRRP